MRYRLGMDAADLKSFPSKRAVPGHHVANHDRSGFAMQKLFNLVGRQFKKGSLEFRTADGRVWRLGQCEPRAFILLKNPSALLGIALNPRLRFAEAYMDGDWEPADGD